MQKPKKCVKVGITLSAPYGEGQAEGILSPERSAGSDNAECVQSE